MAKDWCLAYGVMDETTAKKEYKAMVKRNGDKKAAWGSNISPPPSSKSKSKTGGKKRKKSMVLDDVAYDAGMDAGGDEGIGMAAM